MLEQVIRKAANRIGIEVTRVDTELSDLSPDERRIVTTVRPFTMTGLHRIAALVQAIRYTIENSIPGSFVECGVWKGGSSMAAALTYLEQGVTDVDMFLFDTFAGMPAPGREDYQATSGIAAEQMLARAHKGDEVWAFASMEEVSANLLSTGYPADRIHLIKGLVEDTIPMKAPDKISVLRLDTDWYSSTKHELHHLFPRLSKSGLLIIDDYGHWAGAKQAVDEYFLTQSFRPLLHRIDQTGRICVKA